MSAEHGEDIERRKENMEVGKKLSRIETMLEGIKEQISARFESVKSWQSDRDNECGRLEEDIVKIRIEQAMQGVKVGIWSVVGSAIMAGIVTYFVRK